MVNRTTFNHLSTPPLPGGGVSGLMQQYAERLKTLFDASGLPLTAVGGTANAVTATLDPALDGGGLVDGMKFEITWAATNTAGVTLAMNGAAAVPVVDPAGTALDAGAVGSGLRSLLEYIGGSFRILSPLLSSLGGGSQRYYQVFTSSGTWLKPAGLDDDTMVFVEGWGGGGGGSSGASGGGGGGGTWLGSWFRLGDLPSSVAVTIGVGGAVNTNGSNSTFGSLLTFYAGNGTAVNTGGQGGGAAPGGALGGGPGGGLAASGSAATMENGGAGGGGGATALGVAAGNGGQALRGGGGGGGISNNGGAAGSGGASVFGGIGGAANNAGTAPGGGGGRNAAGARGEIRVWI